MRKIRLGGGAALTEPSASSSGSGSVVKQEKPEDPNNLFANNPKLKEALYYRVKADSDVSVPDSIDRWHPTESDMARVKKLDLENWKIDDVRFLKYFPNLEDLNLSENTISDISQLPSLKNLKKLDLRRNNISIIPVLNGLPNLESLDISENKISNVDNLANLCAGKLINVKAEKNNI
ncbi:leucine-rich repeat domain-containing protein, partial [Gardnerella pickettii]|uniref:leucine-rich repeat domain-containing protein n=2 Tax=Gardnerella TaxID=2701 RepID=UPI0039EE97ED